MKYVPFIVVLAFVIVFWQLHHMDERIEALEGDLDQLFYFVERKAELLEDIDYRVADIQYRMDQ